ncbi:hypothetical protein HMPREF0373_03466 [Eubacterium ramulus ATCC 29099]|uniref:Uncharacterized protein n=1 Tax=Eubacterium ramulus ATCC 29099 TaxID=1256908 RepID=U2PAI0_EUBRA|nr:hypothetical protein HMPREF0373_03466 [Eubacterium ramulus ATCC 29099]
MKSRQLRQRKFCCSCRLFLYAFRCCSPWRILFIKKTECTAKNHSWE